MSGCEKFLIFSYILAYSSACILYTCTSSYHDYCLNILYNTAIYSKCYPGYYCPDFSIEFSHITYCTPLDTDKPNTLTCPTYLTEGMKCTPSKYCKPGLYCKILDKQTGLCTQKVRPEEDCSQSEECSEGFVCSKGGCIRYFSLKVGEKADHMIACESAILKNGVCMPESKTIGNPGKSCEDNEDCRASDGQDGLCVCAPNTSGVSFCKFHISDFPTKQALASRLNGYISEWRLLMFEVMVYPIVQHSLSCYEYDSMELK